MSAKTRGWGVGVWVLFGSFVVFILACVGFASFQRFDLVDTDYYQRAVAYQDHINKLTETRAQNMAPAIDLHSGRDLVIRFPERAASQGVTGAVRLFRPSNARWDRRVELALDSLGSQSIPVADLIPGFWRVKIDWESDGDSYYHEEALILE